MNSNETNPNIIIESEKVPIHVTEEEHSIFMNAKSVEDVKDTSAYKKWSELIKEKSDYKCECCGAEEDLVSHHFLSFKYYPALRLDLKNGVCLCQKCHDEYHSQYKLKDTSLNSLLAFIKNYHDNK